MRMNSDRAVNRALAIADRAGGGRVPWTASNELWNSLDDYQKAAAMALMEADGRNFNDARNAAGAMVNRAAKSGESLGEHTSKPIYQPTIEPAQQQRLSGILKSPEFGSLTTWVKARSAGDEPDPVAGATHFLAKPQVMLSLESRQPDKYKNWGPRGDNWTGYDPKTGQYANQTIEDGSHAFLAPEGKFSAPYLGEASVGESWASNTPSAPVSPSAVKIGAVLPPPSEVADVTGASDGGLGGFGSQFLAGLGKMASAAGVGQPKQAQAAPQPMQLHPYAPNPQQIAAAIQMAQAGTPYARGGSVARAMKHVHQPLDTGKNIPESTQTLQLQQQQLVDGRRPAQMFPLGTPELPLPDGMRRLETARGVFHYNPFVISAADVQKAAATGRENEILGIGPHSKADVEAVARQTGESPMVLTERAPNGAEVKGSLTVPSLARDQGAAIEASKTLGNTVSVEPLGQVLSDRSVQRAQGGQVAHDPIKRALKIAGYADGGSVDEATDAGLWSKIKSAWNGPNQQALLGSGGGSGNGNDVGVIGKLVAPIPGMDPTGQRSAQGLHEAIQNTAHTLSPKGLYDVAHGVYDAANRLTSPVDDIKGYYDHGDSYVPYNGAKKVVDAIGVATALAPLGGAAQMLTRGERAVDAVVPRKATIDVPARAASDVAGGESWPLGDQYKAAVNDAVAQYGHRSEWPSDLRDLIDALDRRAHETRPDRLPYLGRDTGSFDKKQPWQYAQSADPGYPSLAKPDGPPGIILQGAKRMNDGVGEHAEPRMNSPRDEYNDLRMTDRREAQAAIESRHAPVEPPPKLRAFEDVMRDRADNLRRYQNGEIPMDEASRINARLALEADDVIEGVGQDQPAATRAQKDAWVRAKTYWDAQTEFEKPRDRTTLLNANGGDAKSSALSAALAQQKGNERRAMKPAFDPNDISPSERARDPKSWIAPPESEIGVPMQYPYASGGSVSSPIDRALRVAHGYASGGGVGLEDTVDALYRATLGMTPPEREKYIHDWWAARTMTNDRPRAETAPVPPVKRGDSRPSAPDVPAMRDPAPQPSDTAREPYRGDPPTPGAELKSYTPPRWSDRVANGFGDVLDAVGIDSAGPLAKHYTNSARMTAGLLPPVGLHDGAVEMKQGYDRGDTNQMIRGGVEAGLSLPGFMGAKSGVQSMMARRAASLEEAAAAKKLAVQNAADAAYRADPLSEIKRGIEQRRALRAQRVIDEAAAKAEASRLNVPLRQNELTNDVVGRDVSSIKDGLSGETLSSKAAAGELGPNDFARDVSSIRPSRGQDLPIEDLPTTTQTPPPTSLDRELFVQDQRPIGQIGAEDFGSTMVDPPRQMRGLAGSDDGLTGGASDVPGGFTKGVSDVENTMPDNIGNIKKPSRARITDEQKADRATYTPAHRKAVKEVLGDLANRTPEEIQALPGLEPKPTADAFGRLFKSRGLPEVPPRELLRRTEGTDKEFGKLQEVGADFKRPATLKRLQGGPNKLAVPLTAGIAGAASGDDGEPSTDISPASDRESAIDRALRASGQYASGGGVRPGNVAKPINKAITLAQGHNPMTGPIHGVTPGRADHIATSVPAGSHILPADLVSGLGQGNTNAGMHVLHKMFKASKLPRKFASGGSAEPIDVLLSDGEYAIHPDIVAEIGGGNMQHGHDILDHWILSERARNIEELKNLPPPAKD